MRKRTLFFFVVALTAGTTLTACSTESPAVSAPQTTSTAPSAPTLPSDGAPAVPKPLNAARIEADPCSPITAAQVASLGQPQKSATVNSDALGPGCSWRFASEDPSSFSGGLLTNDPQHSGISGIYSQHTRGSLTKFSAFSANGYPGAVYSDSTNPLPGECVAAVGVRDDLAYVISISLYSGTTPFTDPCELGKKVAGFVIEYLQKGQS